jgi:cardiolipin synthase
VNRLFLHVPNLMTSLRLVAAPFLALLVLDGHYEGALGLFAFAGATDAADGFVARRFGLMTELGRFLDPLADKFLMLASFIVLVAIGVAPVWLASVVIGRDLLVVLGAGLAWAFDLPLRIAPLQLGKISTALQIAYIAATLLLLVLGIDLPALGNALAVLVAGFTLASGLNYATLWLKALARASRTA